MAGVARLTFTSQLQRFTPTPELETRATTLRAALEEAFGLNPQLRGYVLDEQGHLRPHVVVYIDGRPVRDRSSLADPLRQGDRVYVLQALTGG